MKTAAQTPGGRAPLHSFERRRVDPTSDRIPPVLNHQRMTDLLDAFVMLFIATHEHQPLDQSKRLCIMYSQQITLSGVHRALCDLVDQFRLVGAETDH